MRLPGGSEWIIILVIVVLLFGVGRLGRIGGELRLPLVPLSPQFHDTVRSALREAGCLS